MSISYKYANSLINGVLSSVLKSDKTLNCKDNKKHKKNKFQSQRPLTTGSNSTNNIQIRENFTRPTHHKEEDMEKRSTKFGSEENK